MREGEPSRTALSVAVQRALHARAERPPLFVDPFAEAILDEAGRAVLAVEAADPPHRARLRATVVLRSLIAEETALAARDRGVEQVVVLGAGLDTFALRHAGDGFRVFEVDHPATQAWKRARLAEAGLAVSAGLVFVAVDFERDDLGDRLRAAGFRFDHTAVFLLLGVVPYVARPALEATFALAASAGPGSCLVFDYALPFERAPEPVRSAYAAAAARAAAAGEPWVTFFTPADLAETLRRAGFVAIEDLGRAELNAGRLAGRADGFSASPLARIVTARTPAP